MYTIHLFGAIGEGFDMFSGESANSAAWLAGELKGKGDVELMVNSDGGEVFEAVAMRSLLAEHKGHTTARVIGLAASSASFLILAADRVEMAPGTQLMIHNVYTHAMGDAEQLRKTADDLDHINSTTIIPAYQRKTGLPTDELTDMLAAETWIDADTALEQGFIDGISASPTTPVEALLREGVSNRAGMSPERYAVALKAQRDQIRALPLERQQAAMRSSFGQYYGKSLTPATRS